MNPYLDAFFTFLNLHSRTVIKLTCVFFMGVIVLVRYLRDFEVTIGGKTLIRGTTKKTPTPFTWRDFLQLIICMVVYAALSYVFLLAP